MYYLLGIKRDGVTPKKWFDLNAICYSEVSGVTDHESKMKFATFNMIR